MQFSDWTNVSLRNILQIPYGFQEKICLEVKKIPQKYFSDMQNAVLGVYKIELNEEHPIKRTSITLEDPIYDAGQQIASKRGFGQSFSAYIAWLIQRDAEGGVTREEAPLHRIAKASGKKAKSAKRTTKRGK